MVNLVNCLLHFNYFPVPVLLMTYCWLFNIRPEKQRGHLLEMPHMIVPSSRARRSSSQEWPGFVQTPRTAADRERPSSPISMAGSRKAAPGPIDDRRVSRQSLDLLSMDRLGGMERMSLDSRALRLSLDPGKLSLDIRRPQPADPDGSGGAGGGDSPLATREQLSVIAQVLGHLQQQPAAADDDADAAADLQEAATGFDPRTQRLCTAGGFLHMAFGLSRPDPVRGSPGSRVIHPASPFVAGPPAPAPRS